MELSQSAYARATEFQQRDNSPWGSRGTRQTEVGGRGRGNGL